MTAVVDTVEGLALDSLGDGVLATDAAGRVTLMNRVAETLTATRAAQAIGMPVDEVLRVFSEDGRTRLSVPVDGLIRGEPAARHEACLLGDHGDQRFIAQTAAAIRTADGRGVGVVIAFRDVTAQRELQTQLRVAERMVSMGTMAAGVAHEINNPLSALIGNLALLGETLRADPGESKPAGAADSVLGLIGDVREAAERVRFIVHDLKLFSRVEDDQRERIDLQRLLDSSLRMAGNQVRHRARVVRNYTPVPDVIANKARLGQVFVNLMVNAAQAIPEGRAEENQIVISTGTDAAGLAVIGIRDSGSGIPPEVLPHIFEPFYTTKELGIGTGLGLAICQRIVRELAGTIAVESRPGGGTTFSVALPPAQRATPADVSPPTPVDPPPASRRGQVLVVDDEPLVRALVRRTLNSHDVTVESRADDALARIVDGARFDVIVCDIMMPQMTGIDFYEALERKCPGQAERVVFFTGGAFSGQASEFLARTQRPVLDKPFDPRKLRALVNELIV